MLVQRRFLVGVCFAALGYASGCSDKEAAPQEPVAPAAENTPYPEDPALAQADKKRIESATGGRGRH